MRADVFVSSESVGSPPSAELVRALRERGLSVSHSPPWDQEQSWSGRWNTDWDDWYGPNLSRTVTEARFIVLVISRLWQASTWMLAECQAAAKAGAQVDYPKVLIWNPEAIPITNPNFAKHVAEELPRSLEEAVGILAAKLAHKASA